MGVEEYQLLGNVKTSLCLYHFESELISEYCITPNTEKFNEVRGSTTLFPRDALMSLERIESSLLYSAETAETVQLLLDEMLAPPARESVIGGRTFTNRTFVHQVFIVKIIAI